MDLDFDVELDNLADTNKTATKRRASTKTATKPRAVKTTNEPPRKKQKTKTATKRRAAPTTEEAPHEKPVPERPLSGAIPLRFTSEFTGLNSGKLALWKNDMFFREMWMTEKSPVCVRLAQQVLGPICEAIYGDIHCRSVERLPFVDMFLLTPPCDPFTSNGKRFALGDPNGWLMMRSLDYIIAKRPIVVAFEQVWIFFGSEGWDLFVGKLKEIGYRVSDEASSKSDAEDNGTPMKRLRMVMVAVRADRCVRDYQPPERLTPVPLDFFLDPRDELEDAEPGIIPNELHPLVKSNLRIAFKKARKLGHNPKKDIVVTDVGCSTHHAVSRVNAMMTLTANRLAARKYHLSNRSDLIKTKDICRLFWFGPSTYSLRRARVSPRQFRYHIGQMVSVSVLQRVLPRALCSAGLLSQFPRDERAELCAERKQPLLV